MTYAGSTVATVYNGHIYVGVTCWTTSVLPGGCTATANLLIGNISSTGAVSNWTTSSATYTAFGNRDSYAGIMATNGYLYVAGGGNGGSWTNTVNYSQIYASGNVGPAQTTSSLGTAEWGAPLTTYNGYLYIVGGLYASTGNVDLSSTAYAKIDAVGPTGNWAGTAGAGLPTATRASASIAYNGYLYSLGGDQTATMVGTVYYAPVNSTDGTVGTWNSTNSFTGGRYMLATFVYNGYIYMAGGGNNAASFYNDVQYALICTGSNNGTGGCGATAGTVGTWSTTTSMTTSRQGLAAVTYNGFVYATGGYNGTGSVATVEYAQLSATGGVVANGISSCNGGAAATWCALSAGFTNSRFLHSSFVASGYLYIMGGRNSGATEYNDIQSALICTGSNSGTGGCSSAPGSLGTWNTNTNTTTATFPTARDGFSSFVNNGYVYIMGGCSLRNGVFISCATVQSDVQYALICTGSNSGTGGCGSTPGTVGAWNASPSFATARHDQMGAAYNGYVYVWGGCGPSDCNTYQADTQYAPLNNGGSSGTWNTTTGMPNGVAAQQSIALNGNLYAIGGCTNLGCTGGTTSANVNHAAINADGTLGTWTSNGTDTALPVGLGGMGITTYNGTIYVGGGLINGGALDTTIYYAKPTASGAITSWSTGTSFTAGRNYPGMFAYNGYLYVTGGIQLSATTLCNTVSSAVCSDIQFAPINANGSLGAWHFTHNSTDDGTTFVSGFTTARQELNAIAANGYVYVLGGQDNSSNALGDVQYAQLNSNGTVGNWSQTTSLPKPRYIAIAGVYDGYLYAYSGYTASGLINDVSYAPILSNGMLGNWTIYGAAITGSAAQDGFGSGAFANGNIYYLGGQYLSPTAAVQYTPLQVQARVAHYSYLVDLKSTLSGSIGGDPQIKRFSLGFTPASASSVVGVCWQGATTAQVSGNNVFGSSTCTNNATSQSIVAWPSYGRYAFAYITLDDSQSATFPDSSQTTLSEIDTYFRAAPARRLRGGQTFTDMGVQGSTQNRLDTEGP